MVVMIDNSEKRLSIIILVFIIKLIKRQKGQPDFDDIDDKCANLLSKWDMECHKQTSCFTGFMPGMATTEPIRRRQLITPTCPNSATPNT